MMQKTKQAKILIFKDQRMNNLVNNIAETRSDIRKKPGRHYPQNCISKYFPMANSNSFERDSAKKLQLPCGFLYGESWGALKKCWLGYKVAKKENDEILMREYAQRIQKIQTELGIPTASFPNVGLLGDIYFLYDKEKEGENREQYKYEQVLCDKYDVENVEQLVAEGKAEMYDSMLDYKKKQEQDHYDNFKQVFDSWANSISTQEYVKAAKRKWDYRAGLRKELKAIDNEIQSLKINKAGVHGEERRKRIERKNELINQKIIKESELKSVNAIQMVRTDSGWKYCKEIIKDDYRRTKMYKYDEQEPKYHLVDLAGHRLGDYKEENEHGYVNDPYFYKLYLEDKEWEKIYSKI